MTRIRSAIIIMTILWAGSAFALAAAAAQAPVPTQHATGCTNATGGHCVNLASLTAAVQPVPGLEFLQLDTSSLGDILSSLYVFGLGFIGVAALVMLTYGGIKYMIAGDKDPSEAKKYMKNALMGLVLALSSWLILYVINPELVTKLNLTLTLIQDLGPPQKSTKITPPVAGELAPCTKKSSDPALACAAGLVCGASYKLPLTSCFSLAVTGGVCRKTTDVCP